jgi:hypothetical protein
MEENTLENGKMDNNMDMEFLFLPMANKKEENGHKARELDGLNNTLMVFYTF